MNKAGRITGQKGRRRPEGLCIIERALVLTLREIWGHCSI